MREAAMSLALVSVMALFVGVPVGLLATWMLDGPLGVPLPPVAGSAIGFVAWMLTAFILHRAAEDPGDIL